ncbi:TetR/AcrR family transcriptional regulator [Paenisporosarcina cavernae]|uniref:TetR/AcrR family transcriptional regulator n=1 Tax=Paenisporosarcina cavernae TaxID=2320858 RepID=A0A385YX25_9BACL|nr:TetR/AcrR family transcriptional regulator [Paenisporosarcina cavernae]AYC30062.1 TetR/AcrR family transcriptional regulator [Paenisporosarcina cavernae]
MSPKVTETYKRQKVEELLVAAEKVFAVKGYYEATMDDLVNEVSMSKGSIYHYFSSKEEVYHAMLERLVTKSLEMLEERLLSKSSATEKLAHLFEGYKEWDWQDRMKLLRATNQLEHWINGSKASSNERYVAHAKKFEDFLTPMIELGIQEGEFDESISPTLAAKYFWVMMDGVFLHAAVLRQSFPSKEMIEFAQHMFMNYLQRGERNGDHV